MREEDRLSDLLPVCLEYRRPRPFVKGAGTKQAVPESFTLHVGPSACGRRFAIESYERGERLERAHLYIDEGDIVSGCYENRIVDAVEEILQTVKPMPRAVIITTTCMDDLLAIDHEALLSSLRENFSNIHFAIHRIDPIRMRTGNPPPANSMLCRFSLLSPSDEHDNGINLIGNVSYDFWDSELLEIISQMGMWIRQCEGFDTFDEFLEMAQSSLNLIISPFGLAAAQDMEERLSIPFCFCPFSYDIQQIRYNYENMAQLTGRECPDLDGYIFQVEQKIADTLRLMNGMPIVIGDIKKVRSIAMARTLLEYGFNVTVIMARMITDEDTFDFDFIQANYPWVEIINPDRMDVVSMNENSNECLCIGFEAGYIVKARHLVLFPFDRMGYGYAAVEKLMTWMQYACMTEANYDEMTRGMRSDI